MANTKQTRSLPFSERTVLDDIKRPKADTDGGEGKASKERKISHKERGNDVGGERTKTY